MGAQQVSGLICARTETEGKGAGYLRCSPEVFGTGGLRTLNTDVAGNRLVRLAVSNRLDFDLDQDFSLMCVYCNPRSLPLLHAPEKSAQWNYT